MGQPQFVHLHLHTDYSLLDGACETSELLDEASRQKMPAVAITDHGNLFAAANFFYEASKRDVKPIIGCEVYVAKGSRHDRGDKTNGRIDQKYDQARENAYRLRDVFGKGNFFLEIQDQGLPIEKDVNRELVRLSKETGIPLVATNDCHYLHHDDAHAQEVLLCIQTGKTM